MSTKYYTLKGICINCNATVKRKYTENVISGFASLSSDYLLHMPCKCSPGLYVGNVKKDDVMLMYLRENKIKQILD